MPYPATQCFLVEQVNQRQALLPAHCEQCEPQVVTFADIRRTDTGVLIAGRTTWIGHRLPPGAMWFGTMREQSRPTSPEDWSDRPDSEKDLVRKSFAQHPDWYSMGPCESDPSLPKRKPSYSFDDSPLLHVVLANGHQWCVDSRASNCTMPYDYAHRCWVRHGEPPNVTADKNGVTCQAGAGSILVGDYHGFLRDGVLTAG